MNASKKPIAVVTGGAGFIGSHLCETLLNRGFRVRCYDDLSFGCRENVAHISGNSAFEFFHNDVCDSESLARCLNGAETVFHLAARKIPRYGGALSTLHVNNEGTKNVLEAAADSKIRVILASTSDVYGKGTPPFKESDDLVLGRSDIRRWSYAASKVFDEHLAYSYFAEKGLPVVILRFFGSYGPRNHRSWWGGPQAVFIDQSLKGEELTIHGDGSQTRSFTYIDDLVSGIVLAAEREEAIGEIINLGSDQEITILGLANLISGLVRPGENPRLKFVSYDSIGGRYEDVMRRLPDLSKAKKILDFSWKIELIEGLKRTIGWHKEVLNEHGDSGNL